LRANRVVAKGYRRPIAVLRVVTPKQSPKALSSGMLPVGDQTEAPEPPESGGRAIRSALALQVVPLFVSAPVDGYGMVPDAVTTSS
jgi:hypothetical protein